MPQRNQSTLTACTYTYSDDAVVVALYADNVRAVRTVTHIMTGSCETKIVEWDSLTDYEGNHRSPNGMIDLRSAKDTAELFTDYVPYTAFEHDSTVPNRINKISIIKALRSASLR
jgi:hypothetical protein